MQVIAFTEPPDVTSMPRNGVLVFGSINIDLVCRASKIPAPGETILAPSYDVFAGGKGANQAVAAARSGAPVIMVGATGRDAFAAIPVQALRHAGVETASIQAVDAPTGAAFITVSADGENAITVASGANRHVRAAMVHEQVWAKISHILLQGELDWKETGSVAATAKRLGKCVVLNAAPSHNFEPSLLHHVDFLIVNEHELRDVAEAMAIAGDGRNFARSICAAVHCSVVVTRGAQGVDVTTADQSFSMPALAVEVVDTTGAGDTFCGVFAAMLAGNRALADAIAMANIAGGLACTKAGAQSAMPDLAEIRRASSN